MEQKDLRLAVIIDADNIPSANVKAMMEEIAKFGTPTFKRIYGDWTRPHISAWKNVLLENAITPIQQYGYTTGKNSTDSAMIIDAMDILYSNKVDGFCIASSDSDFTRLALRLREAGMKVIGIGEQKTPRPFIVACDKFIYIEILKKESPALSKPTRTRRTEKKKAPEVPVIENEKLPVQASENADVAIEKSEAPFSKHKGLQEINEEIMNLISASVSDIADENGWAFLGDVGNLINKKKPDFDARNFGFAKLTAMIKSLEKNFEIEERETSNGKIKHIFIKIKKAEVPPPEKPKSRWGRHKKAIKN